MTSPAIRWRAIAAQLTALMVLVASAPAATITWDANATTGSVIDGAGAWLGANQWWNGTSHVTWTSGDDAVFGVGGTGGAVTLSAPTTAGSLAFNPFTGAYTLGTAGQALTLGSGGLTMNAGAGAVTLVSPVTLGAAQIWTNDSASLFTTSAATTNAGHLLTVAGSGNASLAAISGAGGLAKSGAGTLSLVGANTYTGGTTVSGGTLTLANGSVSGNFNGVIRGSLTISGGATVNASQGWSLGAGGPNSAQPTTRSVTDITLTGGTLNIVSNATKGGMSPTTVTMTGGSLTGEPVEWYYGNSSTVSLVTNASATTSTVSAPIALRLNKTAGAGSLTFDVAAGTAPDGVDLLVSGAISNSVNEGGGGRIVKSGAGTLRMTAINTYTQGTTVQAGTLSLGNGGANGVIRGSLAIEPGARVVASAQGWSLGFGGTRPGATFAGNSVTAITIDRGTLEFTNGQSGSGLAASEITLTGGTIAGASFGWINSNTLTPTLRTLASGTRSTLEGGITLRLSSAGTLTFDVASGSTADGIDLLVSGPISQPTTGDNIGGAIAKTGPGTLTLTAINTYTGGTVVEAGTLALGNGAANGVIRGSLSIEPGARVVASAQGWSLGYGGTRAGATYPGNSVTAITIDRGTLEFTNGQDGAGLAANTITLTGGTIAGASFGWINSNTLTPTLRTLASGSRSTLQGGISLRLSTAGTLTFDVASGSTADGIDLLVSGPITLATGVPDNAGGSVVKTGAGTLALAAANTFTGATSITGGRLQVEPTGSFTATSGITLAGGELRYNSATALARPLTLTAGTISGTGTIATPVSLATGGVLSPGNSPGTQAYSQGLTWNGGGAYLWEVNALSGTAGTNWDLLDVSGGTFDLSGLSAESRFILDLTTLTAADLPGPLAVPYDGGAYTFPLVTYTSLSSPLGTAALTDLTSLFTIGLDDWAAPKPALGDISVRINAAADGIELVVVPEPAFAGAALVAAGIAAWRRRRRPRTSP